MPKFEAKHKVKITQIDKKEIIQEAHIDTDDEAGMWIVVTNDGNSMSMSFENWKNLEKLVAQANCKALEHVLQR
ncbi:hypothetical protein [uncultured Flavobacterium sp.]|uniref:hypothetical protein n=1 Tax=uncultured Flavobacterium sp. TaxID=165435 RepID=UPI0030EBB293|tara:strand:+ start:11538 stop:11759 length:222 start_codon:yes stop_codon:yes gene_type:complete